MHYIFISDIFFRSLMNGIILLLRRDAHDVDVQVALIPVCVL